MATVDLDRLGLFLRRGERVVVVLPDGEPLVLVPLGEYEKLSAQGRSKVNPEPTQRRSNGKAAPAEPAATPKSAAKAPEQLERVDPPQGGVADDDQYYPEPLEG